MERPTPPRNETYPPSQSIYSSENISRWRTRLIAEYFLQESYAPYTHDLEAITQFLEQQNMSIPPASEILHAWLCGTSPPYGFFMFAVQELMGS